MNLPKKINIIEVGPRDGLQNISKFIDTEIKIKLINKLAKTGLKKIEVTSFVNPKVLPQMKDAAEILKNISKEDSVRYSVLIPNIIGAKLALQSGAKELNMVISASESHNLKNVGKRISHSLEELEKIKNFCTTEYKSIRLRVSVATVFGCPFEGQIPIKKIKGIIERLVSLDVNEIILCDTSGMGNPLQVQNVIRNLQKILENTEITVHFHNTKGNGIVNTFSALTEGVSNVETSIGGLGGCPFIPRASGNVATEDLVNLLNDMKIETDIDLVKLIDCVKFVKRFIKDDLDEYMLKSSKIYS